MSTVRVALDPHGQVKDIPICDGVLHIKELKSEFQEATGLKYCDGDGVWTAVEMENDAFKITQNDSHLFVVVNNVFTVDGPDDRNFDSCKREYTSILKPKPPRNLAVIIGNFEFPWENDKLPGAKTDLKVMTMMLSSPPFNFTVLKCSNLTRKQMEIVAKDAEHLCTKDLKSFLWFISTHGYVSDGHQMLKGIDGTYVKLTDLIISTPDPSTPKVYLVNACRFDGRVDQVDLGAEFQVVGESAVHGGGDGSAGDDDESEARHKISESRSGGDPSPKIFSPIPADAYTDRMIHCPTNFLLVYGCPVGQGIPDYVPHPPERISWLVHSLKKVVKRYREAQEPVNLLSLLTEANGYCCCELDLERRKYTFVLEHRLTSDKGLCFP
ncbi:uncharacterized protein LOC110449862 [Mizuhopecten yessoensis]|uniref:Caspase family p20 domain-containing protein n=1 Tax=Mizuhopecten yessoensis TaxID=6573 RepID=A0A210QQD5_MIZYE|nr:uncharacterized protein LOC110449862 [Mizuhopecten yessoensis]OWF50924.1 hypothetical protein KP79_PYT04570 [Mizuhopecten yessoensis]